jgi:hypothetical protein
MDRKALRGIKKQDGKRLVDVEFGPLRKRLPKPLDKLAGKRFRVSALYEIGAELAAVFVWKTGDIPEKRALYGWLFVRSPRGLVPLVRLDYHPSHKNLHLVANCERGLDLTNRGLPGCPEFALRTVDLDPDVAEHRMRFVSLFCERLNIRLGEPGLL